VVRRAEPYTDDPLSPTPDDPVYMRSPGSYGSELQERLASPLYTWAFVLVVLAFMGQAQTTRTSRTFAVVCAFVVAVLFRVIGIMLSNHAVVRPAAVPLLYAAPACAALFGVIMTQWRLYPRRRSRLPRALTAILEGLARAVLLVWPRRSPAPVPFGTGG